MESHHLRLLVVSSCAAAVIGIASPAFAQQSSAADPMIGTWKLNLAKSTLPAAIPGRPKSQMEVYREVSPGQLEMVLSRVQDDGTTMDVMLVWPVMGGAVELRKGPRPPGETLVETRLGPGDWLVTYMMNGRQYGTMRKTVSRDGKTMQQMFTGMVEGKPLEAVFVMERE